MSNAPAYLERPTHRIAYHSSNGAGPSIIWLGGFRSDMDGTKALALEAAARETNRAFVRFDYFGHGASDGAFADGTISIWREDALAVIDALSTGPLILVGSSMGGWIALLCAMARPDRIAGMTLIAPAADFTQALMWDQFDHAVKREILETGQWLRPSPYGEGPYPITRELIEDGRRHLVLDSAAIPVRRPVRVLHGSADTDVPTDHVLKTFAALESADATLTLVKGGDHRLSTPRDLERLTATVLTLAAAVS